jgi:hypothetical protein
VTKQQWARRMMRSTLPATVKSTLFELAGWRVPPTRRAVADDWLRSQLHRAPTEQELRRKVAVIHKHLQLAKRAGWLPWHAQRGKA